MNFLVSILAFILAIGVLVAIHEFGHYWVARKVGVKVLRFSIGFGKPLWKRVAGEDQTEYVIAAIPLGGYVKMLDEREGEVAEHEVHRAFNRQSVWKRIAIVVAGPMANFLLAILLYTLVFVIGTKAVHPLVGNIKEDTPAAVAGIPADSKIVAINGSDVYSWDETRMSFLNAYLENKQQVDVSVETENSDRQTYSLDLSSTALLKEENDFMVKAGIETWEPKQTVTLTQILPDSAALGAGLRSDDIVLQIDDMVVDSASRFVNYVRDHANKEVSIQLERGGDTLKIPVLLKEKRDKGKQVGSLGAGLRAKVADDISAKDRAKLEQQMFLYQRGLGESFILGLKKTWQMSIVTLKVMGRLVIGEASLKNISGPVTIAEFAGKTVLLGLTVYLSFLAIISVSLGVLNLLPIPMLDGGHLLYYIIELFRGKPVSEQVEAVGFRIGIALVGSMMILALYNDLVRLMN